MNDVKIEIDSFEAVQLLSLLTTAMGVAHQEWTLGVSADGDRVLTEHVRQLAEIRFGTLQGVAHTIEDAVSDAELRAANEVGAEVLPCTIAGLHVCEGATFYHDDDMD